MLDYVHYIYYTMYIGGDDMTINDYEKKMIQYMTIIDITDNPELKEYFRDKKTKLYNECLQELGDDQLSYLFLKQIDYRKELYVEMQEFKEIRQSERVPENLPEGDTQTIQTSTAPRTGCRHPKSPSRCTKQTKTR